VISNIPTVKQIMFDIVTPLIGFFILSRGSVKQLRSYFKNKKEVVESIKQAEMTLIGLDERLDSLKRKGNYH